MLVFIQPTTVDNDPFNNDINEFSWLKQFGELFEVGNQQINWLFHNNINQFSWLQ